jgi:hypothetical protein
MDDSGARIWTKAVALTAVFLLGGALGYVVGRPSQLSVGPSLATGQVRAPELSGLTVEAATRVLSSLGLRVGRMDRETSREDPEGVVVDQQPRRGSILRPADAVDLVASSGPGPRAGPQYVFAQSVLIPIDHTGTYRWTSPSVVLDGLPASLGANTRVIGRADVSPYRISADPETGATGMGVTFQVTGFRSPAWFVILRAYARQREFSVRGSSLTVEPRSGPVGSTVTVEGHLCQGTAQQPRVTVWAIVTHPRRYVVGAIRYDIPASSYAFSLRVPIPKRADAFGLARGGPIRPGDHIRFQTSPPTCHSASDFVVQ